MRNFLATIISLAALYGIYKTLGLNAAIYIAILFGSYLLFENGEKNA